MDLRRSSGARYLNKWWLTIVWRRSQWKVVLTVFTWRVLDRKLWWRCYRWGGFLVSCHDGRNHFYAYLQARWLFGRSYFYLSWVILDLSLGEVLSLLLHFRIYLIQVVVQVLENHIQFLWYQQNFLQLYYVVVVEFPQRFDLSQLNALIPTWILLLHFLYRHQFACLYVGRLVNSPECTVSEGLDRFVFLHLCLIINKINSSKSIIEP